MKGLSTVALEVALCNDGDVMVDDDDATIDNTNRNEVSNLTVTGTSKPCSNQLIQL